MANQSRNPQLVKKYKYIVAWSQMMGSFGYYIDEQLEQAQRDKAPVNAIYYSTTEKQWQTTDNLPKSKIEELDEYIAGTKGGVIINW
jgi:hypothetical protein